MSTAFNNAIITKLTLTRDVSESIFQEFHKDLSEVGNVGYQLIADKWRYAAYHAYRAIVAKSWLHDIQGKEQTPETIRHRLDANAHTLTRHMGSFDPSKSIADKAILEVQATANVIYDLLAICDRYENP